ncbi:MAG: LysM peptidoglycan-binding domain-containing protein [Treponema sp.]|nr:LysM peptidoglycan-binding domain-containing protein [Treponema sp.]
MCGIHSVFAQYELPEPVFHEASPRGEPGTPPVAAGFWLPDFSEVVYYLWDFDPANLPEPAIFLPAVSLAAAASSDAAPSIPQNLRNNRYYLESVRLTNLAQQSFDYGDYDGSANYSAEAIRYAQLSDEYVALQLKIKETNDAIAAAKSRIDWASSSGAAGKYPVEYGEAQKYYETSLSARSAEDWDGAIEAAHRVINVLAYIQAPSPEESRPPLPAQYTVRPWNISKDCLWNIAGRPWAYGDPTKWRLIYNANRTKMPEPDNPDLIHPGMILDIPSIKGEVRQGMWDSGKTYSPLP